MMIISLKYGLIMDETGFSGLPVLKKNKLIGMITRKDIIKSGHVRTGLDAVDRSIKVEKVMVTPPVVVTPETSVNEAAELMVKNDIGRLPVVENPVYIKKEPHRAREANINWYNCKRRYFRIVSKLIFRSGHEI